MSVWAVLALCAVATTSRAPFLVASAHIPFSEGRDRVFSTTAELIKSFLSETPTDQDLPAVIPSDSHLPARIPNQQFKAPKEINQRFQEPEESNHQFEELEESNQQFEETEESTHQFEEAEESEEPDEPASVTGGEPSPPRPVFTRSMHLRNDLSVLHADYTETYDMAYHADSKTARTRIENTTTIYRGPAGDGQVQYLKIKVDALSGKPMRRCTKSPPIPYADSDLPGLPDLKPYQFAGYKTEGGRQVEHWQHVVVGKPGEDGAVRGESLNNTYDFFVYRDGGDAVPLRYKVTIDSSVLGPASDVYIHRYKLLPAPTAPLIPDIAKLCDEVQDYNADKSRRRRAALSKEEFIWLINAKKEQVDESTSNDLTQKADEIAWSY